MVKANGPAAAVPNGHVLISNSDASNQEIGSNFQNNPLPDVLHPRCPLLSFVDDGDIDEGKADDRWNAYESTSEYRPVSAGQRHHWRRSSHQQNQQEHPRSHRYPRSANDKMESSLLLLVPTANSAPTPMSSASECLEPLNLSSWPMTTSASAFGKDQPLFPNSQERWSSDSVGEMSSSQQSSSTSNSKQTNPRKRSSRRSITNPYGIWKRKFLRDYNCTANDLWKEVLFTSLPHCVVFLLICAYVILGTVFFRLCDADLAELPFHDVLLFAFTTITTIGYGNIAPKTEASRLFCVIFCIIGIPLAFIALASAGEWLAETYWICVSALRRQKEVVSDDVARLPLCVVICLILIHSLLGGLIFHFWIDEMPFVPAVYFSFISITTIGFGDLCPTPSDLFQTMVTIGYLSSGIVIMSTLFGTLSNHLRRLHYLGREFTGARNVQVWFGGTRLSIRELVHVVASQFEISPERFQEVLYELDDLVRLAANYRSFEQREGDKDDDHHRSQLLPGLMLNNHYRLSNDSENAHDNNTTPGQLTYSSRFTDRNEQEQMIQALSTLYHLTIKGNYSFQSPSKPVALSGLKDLSVPLKEHQFSTRSLPSTSEPKQIGPQAKFSVVKLGEVEEQSQSGQQKQSPKRRIFSE